MFINTNTLQYNLTERHIRNLFPNTSFPKPFVPPSPYVVYFPIPVPEHDPVTEGVRELTPEQTGPNWYQVYEVYDLDQEVIDQNLNEIAVTKTAKYRQMRKAYSLSRLHKLLQKQVAEGNLAALETQLKINKLEN